MKLLYQQEKYLRYHRHKCWKIQFKKLQKAHKNKYEGVQVNNNADTEKYTPIRFSENVFLGDEEENIFKCISEAAQEKNIRFIFSDVKRISVGSALYIKAFIDYQYQQNKNIKISCNPRNRKMRQILQHMNIKNYGLAITYNDIKCWILKNWNSEHPEKYGEVLLNEIFPKVLNGKIPSNAFSEIASGLHELLANCSEHAYTEEHPFKGFYLVAGEYENKSGRSNTFSFCVVDMGQGFKSSLHKNSFFASVMEKMHLNSDGQLIKAAANGEFNADISKTKGRGTGLPAVKEDVDLVNGSLFICSDKGSYSYKTENGKVSEEILPDKKYSTIGSIITVSLPIN